MYQRIDQLYSSITESFSVDKLNRLTMSVVDDETTFAVVYQNNGNISSKSDLGEYNYGQDHPHALSSVECYDAIQYSMQDISYTSFNMAYTTTQGDSTLVFVYGPEYMRKERFEKIIIQKSQIINKSLIEIHYVYF